MAKEIGRTSKFLKNSCAQFLYQGILMITGFVLPRVMLTCYGSQINGLVSSIGQFVSYFSLVEAGLSAATVYSLYKPLANKDYTQVSRIVCAAKNFYYKAGFLFFILVSALALVYPHIIDENTGLATTQITILVFVCSASGVLDFFLLSRYRALFTADQKSYVISIAMMSSTICNVLVITAAALAQQSILLAKTLALVSILVKAIIIVGYAKRHYSYISYKVEPDNVALNKRWDALFQQILSTVQLGAPTIILTVVSRDLALVSVYAIYAMIASGIDSLLSIFVSGLAASFGEVIAKNEQETLKNAFKQFEIAYYCVITIIYSAAMVLIRPFVEIYTSGITDANYLVPVYAVLFIANGFFYNIKTPHGMLVLSAGLYKETRYRALIQALIAVIVGCILARPLGIIGVMIGMISSNVYRSIDLLFFIPKKVTHVSYLYTLKHWGIMLPVMALSFWVSITLPINAHSYTEWIIVAVLTTVVATVVVVALFMLFDFTTMKKVINRCLSLVKK